MVEMSLPERVATRAASLGLIDRAGVERRSTGGVLAGVGVGLRGHAAVWDVSYGVAGGPERGGWVETIRSGALRDVSDVRLLVDHEGIPLARTASGTMRVSSDDVGILVEADLDVESPLAWTVLSAVGRGDMSQMSVGMIVREDRWSDDWTVREVAAMDLVDVSVVAFPASPTTDVGVVLSAAVPGGDDGSARHAPVAAAGRSILAARRAADELRRRSP